MSTHSSLDRESFQKLLANAFAVQESQMETQSLSAIVEVQRMITSDDLDLEGAMHLIADRTRNVANAAGVAIGLLKGDQLVYRAGSGSAATYPGRHVMATLSVSADTKTSREILRVENAQTDTRIEAAICRRFGAEALLILLIYHDRAVMGVLEVLFSEAHCFQDREVRTYRLMAGLVGEAMSHTASAQLGQKKTLELSSVPRAIQPITSQMQNSSSDGRSAPEPPNKHAIYQACGAAVAGAATTIMRRVKSVPLHKPWWSVAVAGVVTALVIACWIAYSDRRPASPFGTSALERSNAPEQQAPFVPAKPVPAKANSTSKPQTMAVAKEEARTARLQRVRVGYKQVDIGEDVTIRYFTPKPAPLRVRVGYKQVDIGEDVTVRYFAPKPVVPPTRRSAATGHHKTPL